jgi:hypothetical protein
MIATPDSLSLAPFRPDRFGGFGLLLKALSTDLHCQSNVSLSERIGDLIFNSLMMECSV